MSYFATMTLREAKRMTALSETYEKQLANLPRGSLQTKERNGNKYYYLSYRLGEKIISKYLGNDESALGILKEQLERRKGVESLLKNIKKELALMNKVLEATK